MKKLFVILLGVLMAVGVTSVATAAMSFDIDFYGLPGLEQGVMDTGETITMNVCQTVNVDLWVRDVPVGNGIPGYGFGFGVLPGSEVNFEIEGWEFLSPALDTGRTATIDGGIAAEAFYWPPGTIKDGDLKLITLQLHCTKPSFDVLRIYDYWPDSTQWVLKDGTELDATILPQQLANLNQVPIPGALWLLGSGLFGLIGIRRKMKK
ncbi:MAG: hypothetical protein DRG83_04030 [Deltaproteobacteria bacterium]|nr:MAG: hypothetical protein DRG83_04030 [Deltaproteobacteria bacterium]